MTALDGSSRIKAAATITAAIYGGAQTVTHAYESPLTTLLCEGIKNYTPEIVRNSTHIVHEIAQATLESVPYSGYLPVGWHWAGRSALILRSGFAAWALLNWLRGPKPVPQERNNGCKLPAS